MVLDRSRLLRSDLNSGRWLVGAYKSAPNFIILNYDLDSLAVGVISPGRILPGSACSAPQAVAPLACWLKYTRRTLVLLDQCWAITTVDRSHS
jgi:hypothetical protein